MLFFRESGYFLSASSKAMSVARDLHISAKATAIGFTAPFVALGVSYSPSEDQREVIMFWCRVAAILSSIVVALSGALISYVMRRRADAREQEDHISKMRARDHADRMAAAHVNADPKLTTVLLCEDEPATVRAISPLLVDRGFEVIPAGSLQEAIQLITGTIQFQCAIIDLMLPGEKIGDAPAGFQVLEALDGRPNFTRVVVTGADKEWVRKVQQRGIEVFTKPINIEDVAAALRKHDRAF